MLIVHACTGSLPRFCCFIVNRIKTWPDCTAAVTIGVFTICVWKYSSFLTISYFFLQALVNCIYPGPLLLNLVHTMYGKLLLGAALNLKVPSRVVAEDNLML